MYAQYGVMEINTPINAAIVFPKRMTQLVGSLTATSYSYPMSNYNSEFKITNT